MKNELRNAITIGIGVILISAVVYFSTAIFVTGEIGNKKSTNSDITDSTDNSVSKYDNMIIAGRVFKQIEETYMVLIFSENSITEDLNSAITSYTGNEKLYKVNTDEAVNKYVISDTDNTTPVDSKDIKVKKIALLTISNGIVNSYVCDEQEIINILK